MKNPSSLAQVAIWAAVAVTLSAAVHASSAAEDKILKDADVFASGKPEALQPYFRALYIEGEHNAVLNFDYLGLAALEQGEYATAEKAFDAAIARIETVYADNASARKARSLFAEEKVKDFKGEPYERAMTYYYRGLLYARTGDYQNARASFLSAEHQSMLSESEEYQSTFGLMDYLAGWASHCDGDEPRASDLGEQAAKLQPQVFGSMRDSVSFVGLIDMGDAPVKYGIGKYHERLAFKPAGDLPELSGVTAQVDNASSPVLGADLNWQASTRGGRAVDAVLNGKAQWKSGTETASNTLTAAGYAAALGGVTSNNQGLQNAGEIGMAIGLVSGLFSAAMTPAADTRAWRSLPGGISLVSGEARAGVAPALTFSVGGEQSSAILSAQSGKCSIAWGRTLKSALANAPNVSNPVLAESKHEAVNGQFRSMLSSTFEDRPASSVASTASTKEP